jgi:hypothetical protein
MAWIFVGNGKDNYIIREVDKLIGKFHVASIDPATVKLYKPTTSLETLLNLMKGATSGRHEHQGIAGMWWPTLGW